MICCTSADEASKLNVALASGLAAVNASPTSVNDSVSDAAANTVMSPSTAGVVAVVGVRGGRRRGRGRGFAWPAPPWSPADVVASSPQAAATRPTATGDEEQA